MPKASRIHTLGKSGQQLGSEQSKSLGGSSFMPLRHKCEKEIEEEMTWRKRFIVDKREHIARGRHTSRRVQSGHDPEAGRGTRCSNQEAQKRTG